MTYIQTQGTCWDSCDIPRYDNPYQTLDSSLSVGSTIRGFSEYNLRDEDSNDSGIENQNPVVFDGETVTVHQFELVSNKLMIGYNSIENKKSVINTMLEKYTMMPLPIKVYMTVFGTLSIALGVLFFLQLFIRFNLWSPVYTFFGLLCSLGLFFTSYIALKDWSNLEKRNG